jgi:hypothetical protein
MSSRVNERAEYKSRRAQDKEWWKPLAMMPDRVRRYWRTVTRKIRRERTR